MSATPGAETWTIRAYAPATDAAGLRTCFVALQELERGIDPAPRYDDVRRIDCE